MTMSLLLSCQKLSKSFGTKRLFQGLSLSVFSGDRVGLIGPNGSGKSTLLKILSGEGESADEGDLSMKKGVKIGYVPQTCEFPEVPVNEVLLRSIETDEGLEEYEKEHLVQVWLSKCGFSGGEPTANRLSGGWKKRLSIIEQCVKSPDLLLLDEPTNHLDLEGVLWLEKFLLREVKGYVVVSHDRYFLQGVVNRIIEINRMFPEGIFSIDGSYQVFLEKKQEFLNGQLEKERSLASKARKEVDWLSRSPQARTTKSKSRVDQANQLLAELANVRTRNIEKKAQIDFVASERETRKLVVAKNLSKTVGGKELFRHLDFILSPRTRMGLIGPNGSGKTTLLRLMSGEVTQDLGNIKWADDLKIVYFDQHRVQLPQQISLREALSPQGDYILFHGRSIHVNGWCKRFLFSPEDLERPIGKFSGGERARIAIAHLMLQPADLLLLDEPTNDLDIPTLEILEETLLDFPGAVVLITHDRCMLDRVCNGVLVLGGDTGACVYADYAQWQASLQSPIVSLQSKEKNVEVSQKKKGLSYLELREYGDIEKKIPLLEEEVRQFTDLLETDEVAKNPIRLSEVCTAMGLVETQIEQLYLRWDQLNKKREGVS